MELEREVLGSPTTEVPVVEGEVVLAIRALADCGVGSKVQRRAEQLHHSTRKFRVVRGLTDEETNGVRHNCAGTLSGGAQFCLA
jgi:hypothetical protein